MAETPAGTPTQSPEPATIGERLRAARESAGLDLAEIAARTRIPQRHLEAIEQSDFSALPSPTYAFGFAKAYARAVGLDEAALARNLRATLSGAPTREPSISTGEIEEPSRLPSPAMTIGLVIGFLVLIVAAGLYYGGALLRGGDAIETASVADELGVRPAASVPVPVATPSAAPATNGPVVLTAKGEVWLRIYDAANDTLVLRTFQAGERFEVPATANRPMINTGRPDLIDLTVGGQPVAPLGTAQRAIKDVEISASALLARAAGATPAATPSIAPMPTATQRARTTQPAPRPDRQRPAAAAAPATPAAASTEIVQPLPEGE
jgi:transcriptional regulator with XRE-family HTH domain